MLMFQSVFAMCTKHNPCQVSLDYGTRVEIIPFLRRVGGVSFAELSNIFYGKVTVLNVILGANGNKPAPFVSFKDNFFGVDLPLAIDYTLGGVGYDCRVTQAVNNYKLVIDSVDEPMVDIIFQHLSHPKILVVPHVGTELLFRGRMYCLNQGVFCLKNPTVNKIVDLSSPLYVKEDGLLVKKIVALVPFKVVKGSANFMVVSTCSVYSLPQLEFRFGDLESDVISRLYGSVLKDGFVILNHRLMLDFISNGCHFYYTLVFCRYDGFVSSGLRWFKPDIPVSDLLRRFSGSILGAIDTLDEDSLVDLYL